jgi:diaminopimelate epimerase
MKIKFTKYQGTGNDFILIDNRLEIFPKEISIIQKLTDRKFGVGADGVILIEDHPQLDFRMIYYNSDGSQSLCGNGSRCAVVFSRSLGLIEEATQFETTDGIHSAHFADGLVHFGLHDVEEVLINKESSYTNTGSPHHIEFVDNVNEVNVMQRGVEIRNSQQYAPDGVNVNFAEVTRKGLKVRTYERGVENETLSCGTGVTAAALAASFRDIESPVVVETRGGTLSVSFHKSSKNQFREIYLAGPTTKVFEGTIDI